MAMLVPGGAAPHPSTSAFIWLSMSRTVYLKEACEQAANKPSEEERHMWKRWLSLRGWVQVFRRIGPLLASPRVPLREKLLFAVPAVVYWIMPDALPGLPFDDMAVTLFLMHWFTDRAERKYLIK